MITSSPGIDSEDTDSVNIAEDTQFQSMGMPFQDGDSIDAQMNANGHKTIPDVAEKPARGRQRAKPDEKSDARTPKAGPPTLDEWSNFFSRVVLRVATEYYINYAFRGIDENALTDREVQHLAMTDEEREMISTPFAELSNKSKFMRKHGRMIVASGDAFNAMVVIGVWASRVNRIAAKYRPRQPKTKVTINGNSGQNSQGPIFAEGANGGRVRPGFDGPIFPGTG